MKYDFTKIKSVPALREYVALDIETHYNMFRTPGVLPESARAKLGRSKKLDRDFETILQAGDMDAEGKTDLEIARKLFPGDKNPEGSRTKAFQWVQRYKEIVNGGYEDITLP